MNTIITYLLLYNQYLLKIIYQLLLFIAKYIALKQWVFEDSHSPEYQKFKVDKLPKDLSDTDKDKYKLHYNYREFTMDFFKMYLHELPSRAINFKYKKFNAHIMRICLIYHVNLKISSI